MNDTTHSEHEEMTQRVREAFTGRHVSDEMLRTVSERAHAAGRREAPRARMPRVALIPATAAALLVVAVATILALQPRVPAAAQVLQRALATLGAEAYPGSVTHEAVTITTTYSDGKSTLEEIESWRTYERDRFRVERRGAEESATIVSDGSREVWMTDGPNGVVFEESIGVDLPGPPFLHYRYFGKCSDCHAVIADGSSDLEDYDLAAAKADPLAIQALLRQPGFRNMGRRTVSGIECWRLHAEETEGWTRYTTDVYVDVKTYRLVGSLRLASNTGGSDEEPMPSATVMRLVVSEAVSAASLPADLFTPSADAAAGTARVAAACRIHVAPDSARAFEPFPLIWLGPSPSLGAYGALTPGDSFEVVLADPEDGDAPYADFTYSAPIGGQMTGVVTVRSWPSGPRPKADPNAIRVAGGWASLMVDDYDRGQLSRYLRVAP